MAEEGFPKPMARAGVHEDGALGRGCFRRQLKNHHDLDQLSFQIQVLKGDLDYLPPF